MPWSEAWRDLSRPPGSNRQGPQTVRARELSVRELSAQELSALKGFRVEALACRQAPAAVAKARGYAPDWDSDACGRHADDSFVRQ